MSRIRQPTLIAVCLLLCSAAACADDDWSVVGGGNLQFDWARFDNDRFAFDDDSGFRRARLSLSAKSTSGIETRIEYDLSANAWTDAFLRWQVAPGHSLRFGHFKQPLYLDELGSDKVTLFMEQAAPSAFAIGRRLGAEYAWTGSQWAITGTLFGNNLQGLNAGHGFALRGSGLLLRDESGFVHVGASVAQESPDSRSARFSARPEAALATRRLADSGTLDGVDSIDRAGIEFAWVRGPWLLQSEALAGRFARNLGDFDGSGWYVQTAWLPFGQQRGYKQGVIDAPNVEAGTPAIELGLRLSELDLDDGSVRGGRQSNLTAGVTWWISRDIRLMANWIKVDSNRGAVVDDPRILTFRAQLTF